MYPGSHVEDAPDHPAIIDAGSGAVTTYAELENRSLRFANHLRSLDLAPGATLAIVAENDTRYLEVYWATQRTGLYLTAVNSHLSPPEIRHILSDSEACVVVTSEGLLGTTQEALKGLGIRHRVTLSGSHPEFDDYEAILDHSSSRRPAYEPRGSDMLYSSGTTGRPKGIRAPMPTAPIEELVDKLLPAFVEAFGFDQETVYLSPAPLYHAAPLKFCGRIHSVGGTVVVMPQFDAAAALEIIERYRVTHSQWVPTHFVRMLKLPDHIKTRHDVSSMKVIVHAAAPCPPEVKRRIMEWFGQIVYEYYGTTEANGICLVGPEEWLRRPGTVGRAVVGTPHICEPSGAELPTGEVGRVYFERDRLPFTYHNDPDKTRAAQHPEHETWTTTGDLGYLDSDGYLYLTDREQNTIISGGVNIYPREIEDVLVLHPEVSDVAVVGLPDDDLGEVVTAFVVPERPQSDREMADQLMAFVDGRLARYKHPRRVLCVEELPRTATGKLVKARLLDPGSAPARRSS